MVDPVCGRGHAQRSLYTVEDDQLFLTALQLGAAKPPGDRFGAYVRQSAVAITAWRSGSQGSR